MNKKLSKIIGVLILFVICISFNSIKVYAVLQSNGSGPATKRLNDWPLQIRQMQSSGGSLGLTDSINTSNLSSSNKDLDIHMLKNTEYGALILLSASSYGNPNKIPDGGTTTGNNTGVVMRINKEWVAASSGALYPSALARYRNDYTTTYVAKKGDAVLNWHGATSQPWLNSNSDSALLRGYSNSVFSTYGLGGFLGYSNGYGPTTISNPYASRAAVVVGSGI